MPKSGPITVDEYLDSQPEPMRRVLEQIRSLVRKAAPSAEESISYKMPTYKLKGADLLHFAGWKRHYSLYFDSERVAESFKDELAPYKIQKGTISFPVSQQVPERLIERIIRFRANQIAE